jgi:glyceraldehyde-3-phosphate dehydrogenase (NAD(P))
VTFHKNRPLLGDRAKVNNLIRRGAKLVVAATNRRDFEKLGMQPTYEVQEALGQATVVIDCTPDGVANQHKRDWFQQLPTTGFLAQGSETDFGKPYARGINDAALVPGEDRFIQVVRCNTHNLAVIPGQARYVVQHVTA